MSARGTVLVMAKAPLPGTVNTRLHPLLGPAGCAALQAVLLRHAVAAASLRGRRVVVAFDPPGARDRVADLTGVAGAVELIAQHGGHLGERMTAAANQALPAGGPLVVIGTDVPTLRSELIEEAFTALRAGAGAVLGPALDGGYWLLGVHWPCPDAFAIDPALWSGPRVAAATRARLPEPVLELPALRDLDTPQDAAALLREGVLPEQVALALTPEQVVRR